MMLPIKMNWKEKVRNPALVISGLKFATLALCAVLFNPDEAAFAGEVVVQHANALDVHSVAPVAAGGVWEGGMYEVSCADATNAHVYVEPTADEPARAWEENGPFYDDKEMTLEELIEIVGKKCEIPVS